MAPKTAPRPPALFSLSLLKVQVAGHPRWHLAVVKTEGDKVASITPLPDGDWDNIDGAIRDLHSAAVQGYRFGNWEALMAGNV